MRTGQHPNADRLPAISDTEKGAPSAVGICCRVSARMLEVADSGEPDKAKRLLLQHCNSGQAELLREAANVADEMLAAALPFAAHDWMDAELEDDSCQLTKHSGKITVGHWRALRNAIAKVQS